MNGNSEEIVEAIAAFSSETLKTTAQDSQKKPVQ
jgi:hypothetical protein